MHAFIFHSLSNFSINEFDLSEINLHFLSSLHFKTKFNKQKEKRSLNSEQRQRLIAEQIAKRPNRPANGGPRTPQERPLVLPGGRKWRNEKDAYNEEFIAEVISSQAELIAGSTLG